MAPKKHETVFGEKITTPKGRLSYPYLLEKNSGGQYPSDKYEATLLIPKSADMSKLKAAVLAVAKQAFGKVMVESDFSDWPIRDGDQKDDETFKGHWCIRAKSKNKPGIVGPDVQPLADVEGSIYGGAHARLSLKPFSYMQGGKPGVTFGLQNVQWLGHGEKFGGGGSNPQDDFEQDQDEMPNL